MAARETAVLARAAESNHDAFKRQFSELKESAEECLRARGLVVYFYLFIFFGIFFVYSFKYVRIKSN